MKLKPQYFVLVALLFLGALIGVLFGTNNMNYLFSRSVDIITTQEGEDPQPAVESLDDMDSEEGSNVNREKLLEELRKELLETENDPDKAIEIRRRIQVLESEEQTPTVGANNE